MKQRKSHFCKICGVNYESCDYCEEVRTFESWRSLCCTQQHYQVYSAINMLREGIMTKLEAIDYLNRIGITIDDIKTFIPAVQDILLPIVTIEDTGYEDDEIVDE